MTPDQITALGAQLASMSDQEVARFNNTLEVDDPRLDIVLGYMELHQIDD